MVKRKRGYGLRNRTRAGISIRKQWTRIEKELKSPHKCPSCANPTLRRVSAGVWSCNKCGYQFTGGAYQPETKLGQGSARTA